MGKKRIKTKEGEEGKDGAKAGSESGAKAAESPRAIQKGVVHVLATYNNTMITITDERGNVIAASSAGAIGFRGTKKSTPYAAARVAETISEKVGRIHFPEVVVLVKGVGSGRE